MKNLIQRLIVGTASIIASVGLIYLLPYNGFNWIFVLAISTIIAMASYEFLLIAKAKGFNPLVKISTFFCFLYPIFLFLQLEYDSYSYFLNTNVIFFIFLSTLFFFFLKKGKDPIGNIAVSFFSLIYLAIPLSCWIAIGFSENGRYWLFYLLAVSKMTDIGAYFAGNLLGKHKLAPFVSPKKSVEGAIGGTMLALITSFAFYKSGFSPLSLLPNLLLGVLLSVVGQFGDLAESLLKRDASVKDSNQLPGLGGILDMVDSLIFTTLLLYIIV